MRIALALIGASLAVGCSSDGDSQPPEVPSYQTWKAAYLEPACAAGQMRVKSAPDTAAYTVSEAHGYGMLAVVLADHGEDARTVFDGLVAYYQAHPSTNTPGLMAWAQDQACADVEGADSASDGDLDIAYALLLADARWGSGAAVDYRAVALAMLDALLAGDVHPTLDTILLGDWATEAPFATATRLSDQMPGHFKAFAEASGDARWTAIVDKSYEVIAAVRSPLGLVPDFAVGLDADRQPAPPDFLEGPFDGAFWYNACRAPWRLASDALLTEDPRAVEAIDRLNTFIRAAADDDPSAIREGYMLTGDAIGGAAPLPFVAPFLPAATDDAWRASLRAEIEARPAEGYYGDTLKLLALIVDSGSWRAP